MASDVMISLHWLTSSELMKRFSYHLISLELALVIDILPYNGSQLYLLKEDDVTQVVVV